MPLPKEDIKTQMLNQIESLIKIKQLLTSDRKYILEDFNPDQLQLIYKYIDSFYE